MAFELRPGRINDFPVYEIVENNRLRLASGVDPVQFCRTCSFQDSRLSASIAQIAAARKEGRSLEDLKCQPYKEAGLRRIHQDKTISSTTIEVGPIEKQKEILAGGKIRINLVRRPEKAVAGMADTCGQELLDKCRNCTRLVRQVARFPGGLNANGRPFYVEALLGGHCSIPAEGIVVKGEITYCDRQVRLADPRDEMHNCANCKYNMSFGSDTMLDHSSPLYYELTPFEFDVASDAAVEPAEVGLEIWKARMLKGQVMAPVGPNSKTRTPAWIGLLKTYKVAIVKSYWATRQIRDKEVEVITAVDLRMPGSGAVINFSTGNADDRVGVVDVISRDTAILTVMSPYHRQYGLPDNDRFTYPIFAKDTCWSCRGAGTKAVLNARTAQFEYVDCSVCRPQPRAPRPTQSFIRPVPLQVTENDRSARVSLTCKFCDQRRGQPCAHHAKLSVETEIIAHYPLPNGRLLEQIEKTQDYRDPGSERFKVTEPPERVLQLHRDDAGIYVADANGNPPDYAIFRVRARSILEWCKNDEERKAVMAQLAASRHAMSHTRPRQVDLGWNRPAPADAWHPLCAVNLYDRTYRPGKVMRPDVTIVRMEGGVEITETVGTARGLDFARMWNDSFGTPRSDMSTNPIRPADFGVIRGIDDRRIAQPGIGLDEKFSWTKYQVSEDWLRVNNDGEVVQDEFLASYHHLVQGRKTHHGHEWVDPPKTKVTKLGFAVGNTNIDRFPNHNLPGPDGKPQLGKHDRGRKFSKPEDVERYLRLYVYMPGNDEAAGFWATMRWFILGYENFRNTRPLRGDDIPSVFEFNQTPQSEGDDPDAEGVGFFVCTRCYDPSQGDAGRYSPSEVSKADLSCPNPECDGTLIFLLNAEEWRQGHMQIGSDQIDETEPYRRRSGAPDTARWQQDERLMNMSCPYWTSRRSWR